MSDQSPTIVIGCLLDVSGSMRETLETGCSDEHAISRLRAMLYTALKLAQAEQQRDPHALAFVGVFGLNVDTGCPPVVDLCGMVDALLSGYEDKRTGRELLVAIAKENDLTHITKYIETKLTDEEARIVHIHLRRHPEHLAEFFNAIPSPEQLQNFQNTSRGAGAAAGAGIGAAVSGPWAPLGAIIGGIVGGIVGGITANKGTTVVEDYAVDRSDALQLARRICANLEPRPVADVVHLLQQLQEHRAADGGDEEPGADALLEKLSRYLYGKTPMREALRQSLAAFIEHPIAQQRVLVLVSDGNSTDGDPLPLARELQQANVTVAAVYLTSDRAVPRRRLYDRAAQGWNTGQRTLFDMAARVAGATHPIPVLASMGWEVPSSGECALYTTVCSAAALDEFCLLLLSARFGSADALLDVIGRVQLDAYVDDKYVSTCQNPSNQGNSSTCYAHAIAAVLHMALLRIVGRERGYPSIEEIRTRILENFPPEKNRGRVTKDVLREVITWYPPLCFNEVDEDGARQAVLHRRPVLATFRLSHSGWSTFTQYFETEATRSSVLMRAHMEPHCSLPNDGGHAVVLTGCDPRSLTFLNSWGYQWGNNGSFSIENHTVLELDGVSEETRVCFYDVYWLESDLSTVERQAYHVKVDEELHARAGQLPSILELEASCPHCHANAPIAKFSGSVRRAVCPRCHKSFAPQPGHLVQALYARAGLNDADKYVSSFQEFAKSDMSPQTLQSTLAGGSTEDVKRLLNEHFSSVAKGDFLWLQELREHGYQTEEIAQLLTIEQNDSPWIYFEPRKLSREAIIPDHHEAFCVHTGGQEVRHGAGSNSSTTSIDRKDHRLSWTSDNESLMYIEEFCGIAGVVPNTRDLSKRVGSVKFVEEDVTLTASVSFRSDYHSDSKAKEEFKSPSHHERALRKATVEQSSNILQALENLCSAIAHAQRRGICCDSFTVLQFKSIVSAQEVIELRQIKVTAVLGLYSKFTSFIANLGIEGGNIHHLIPDTLDCGQGVFQEETLSSFTTATFEGILDFYSLAIQFLSLGFSSYIKAHVGAMRPFFLDTSLSIIKLFGLQDWERQSPRLTASLCRFTCLDDMIQNPVLVFREGRAREPETQETYDLLASPEDLVDTWGPGQFITSSTTAGTQNLTAIMLGGGVVKPTAENNKVLHWSNDVDPRHEFSVHFSSREKVLIAGGVQVNGACQANRTERWSLFQGSLQNLGTAADYWQFTEFQAGVAVMGQQFAGGQLQFNKTWTWHPGNSWKRQHLSLISDELPFSELDRPWGLQVSACTGVARRVPLRLLLADMMPIFAENLALSAGWTTLRQRGIIEELEKGSQNLKQWYDELCNLPNSQDLRILTKRLIRHILLVLRDTGIDQDLKTFLIACPQDSIARQPVSMCLPVPCENATLWAKILKDSENCATFAYMTSLCLESQEHKCQQTYPWHCPSLDTAVQKLRPRKEPIIMPPQAWNLEVNSLYWIGVPESGLQARAVKPADSPFLRLYISKSGIPEKTRARLGTLSRLFGSKMDRLREKQIESWAAEDVLILSQSR